MGFSYPKLKFNLLLQQVSFVALLFFSSSNRNKQGLQVVRAVRGDRGGR